MYCLPFQTKRFHFGLYLAGVAAQLLFICNVSSLNLTNTYLHHKCVASEGEYKPGSAYEKNLNDLIHSFSASDFSIGFEHGTVGEPSNSVTIKSQCRGDSYGATCRACFNSGISELLKRCPRNKARIVWFDQCFVETTTVPITDAKSRTMIDYKNNFFVHNPNKVSGDAKLFNKETITFLQNLTVKANDEKNKGKNGEMALYAAGEKMLGTKKLYAMVQCIRDTFVMYEKKLCKKCLDTIINKDFPKCCDGRQGGRVLGTSCDFSRGDTTLFVCNVSSLNLTNTYLHHKCFVDQGEYKSGSQFDKTLTILIDQISELDLRSGADYITIGKSPNAVTVKLQCRGDSYGSMCRSCFKVAISDILKRCPRNKGRIIWYDQCFVETTIVPIDDDKARIKIDYKNNFFLHNPNKVSGDANFFNKETISFLQNLTVKANDEANKGENGEIALYAAGEKMIGTKKLYAMVQCIRDTFVMYEKKLCKKCLDTIINKDFPKCCDGKQGGRVLGTSCTFRYEFYPFLRT